MAGLYGDYDVKNSTTDINVTQYGWTGKEAEEVSLLLDYLNKVEQMLKETQDLVSGISNIIPLYNEILRMYNSIIAINADFEIKYPEIVRIHESVQVMYLEIEGILMEVRESRDFVEARAEDVEAIHTSVMGIQEQVNASKDSIDKSVIEVEKLTQEVRDIAEELRKGQVYRGTWNPHTAEYPDPKGTNSVWDVILNEAEESFKWDDILWYFGDRLVYILDEKKYQQIEAGTSVKSVNGKTGSVKLDRHDVGAAPDGYGLGGAARLVSSKDTVNNAIDSGFYSVMADTADTPSGKGPSGSTMLVTRWSKDSTVTGIRQIFFDHTANRVYTRWLYNGVWQPWAEFYTTSHKPSAVDVGALPLTGGTVTGKTLFKNNVEVDHEVVVNGADSGHSMRFAIAGEGITYIQGGAKDKSITDQKMYTTGWYGTPLTSYKILMEKDTQPLVQQDKIDYKIYHEGFKPTAADVGTYDKTQIANFLKGTIRAEIPLDHKTDLNDVKTAGFYYQPSNANAIEAPNYPEKLAGTLMVTVSAGVQQRYHVYNSSRVYTRAQYTTSPWTPWALEYNSENKPDANALDLVSKKGDEMTGSLVVPITDGVKTKPDSSNMFLSLSSNDNVVRLQRNSGDPKTKANEYVGINQMSQLTFRQDKGNGSGEAFIRKVYHEGFRPTAQDTGAYPLNGGLIHGTAITNATKGSLQISKSSSVEWVNSKGASYQQLVNNNGAWGLFSDDLNASYFYVDGPRSFYINTDSVTTKGAVASPRFISTEAGKGTWGVKAVGAVHVVSPKDAAASWVVTSGPTASSADIRGGIQILDDVSGAMRLYTDSNTHHVDVMSGCVFVSGPQNAGINSLTRKDYVDTLLSHKMNNSGSVTMGSGSNLIMPNGGFKLYQGSGSHFWIGAKSTNLLSVSTGTDFATSAVKTTVDSDGNLSTVSNVIAGGSLTANGGYATIKNGGVRMLEFHKPGKAAAMLYHSDDGLLRFCTSNGAGGNTFTRAAFSDAGDITAARNVQCVQLIQSSDIRIKSDLKEITNCVEKVEALTPYTYFKKGLDDGVREAGLVAQSVNEVLPEAVSEMPDDVLGVNYSGVTALLCGAIQELSKRVVELESKVCQSQAL